MGIGLKILNPGNYRTMISIAKISNQLEKHLRKRCAYCDLDMGDGENTPVVEFVDHLAEKHRDKLDDAELKNYRKIIDKVTR